MKKFLYLLLLLPFLTNCKKENLCQNTPKIFGIKIEENSSQYAYFVDDTGKTDEQNISIYKLVDDLPIAYDITISQTMYINITIFSDNIDFYTNKTETIYLKNKTKTYRLDIKGSHQGNEQCGFYGNLLEVAVDEVSQKVEENSFYLK
ncbi:MAG: hypothetical protein Q4C98_06390 [Capnocytophaga sp.]|nr:hypothetical protein [Capnocytophaga sp.]